MGCWTRTSIAGVSLICALPQVMIVPPARCAGRTHRAPARASRPAAPPRMAWEPTFQQALKDARRSGRPIMVDFSADWCQPCHMLAEQTFTNSRVIQASRHWIAARVDVDEQRDLAARYQITALPTVAFLRPNGAVIGGSEGFLPPDDMLIVMKRAVQREKAASARRTR